jgi:lipid-A-disaccharide synthase
VDVFIVAAEASGDALAADLIDHLKAKRATLAIAGIGGAAMRARGIESAIDIAGLAILGFIDGLRAYKRVVALADAAADAIVQAKPKTVVLVDSWGFTLRVAQRVRARAPEIKLIKYVGPQVWATRPGRAKTLSQTVDHLICIHQFEPPYYAPYGLACTVCGHPAIGRHKQGDADGFRARHNLGERPLVLALPGSRPGEVKRIGPTLFAAAKALLVRVPDACVISAPTPEMDALVRAQAHDAGLDALMVAPQEKDDAFAAATVALAASGTVTTELAMQGAPVVVGYRMDWLGWALARLALRTRYVSLINVAAGKEIAPELIQTRFTVANIVGESEALLANPTLRQQRIAAQYAALDTMGRGGPPAGAIAADVVIGFLSAG